MQDKKIKERRNGNMKINLKESKAITLIALVITIIVLLILAGVSIAMLTGENGILTQANNAKIEQSHGAVEEAISLAYNEWQIEVRTADTTKLASKEVVSIKGEEEKALAGTSSTFLEFLTNKGYIKEGSTDVLDVEALTGGKQALGNGETTDIYKIEEQDGKYVVNYIDQNKGKKEIWTTGIKENTETGEVTLDPDTGKEELILVYNLQNGDTIELPYYLSENSENPLIFNFTVDWGDGTTDNITNADIETKGIHTYNNLEQLGEVKIKISGTFECIASGEFEMISENTSHFVPKEGIDKLVRIEQWGTTGVKTVDLGSCTNLTQLATPTESSFKDLTYASFEYSGITSIPDKLFANCTKLYDVSFDNCPIEVIGDGAFYNCSSLEYFGNFFEENTSLKVIGDYAFANCSNVISFERAFNGCSNLETIGDYAFANCSSVTSFEGMFRDFENLTTIGEHMFEGCESVESYRWTFSGCYNLTGKAPELWLTGDNSEENDYAGTPDGGNCFRGCTGLENYEEIPEYWKNRPE